MTMEMVQMYDIPCFGCGKISKWAKPLQSNETHWCRFCYKGSYHKPNVRGIGDVIVTDWDYQGGDNIQGNTN